MSAPSPGQLVSLLHLCDSLFPIGSFAHSDGLEAATAAGLVGTPDDLRRWMATSVDETFAYAEGPAVARAWRCVARAALDDLRSLDDEVHALRPSSSARQASRTMGTRLVRTWAEIHPESRVQALATGHLPLTLPVAFGALCAAEEIELRAAVEGFAYTRLAAISSSAMRLMSIGQHGAHAVLAAQLARVPLVVDSVLARDEAPSSFTPAFDIASMSHQYVHSRLFRS